ncbi:MAG: spheroidene monooxygenase [Actinobacteria bacterium]|nr:spheroidene monooxygenase [Actinomycetota bacterium]NCA26152.1 spheroidene monooxygenase [Actinomycetota bacterium]
MNTIIYLWRIKRKYLLLALLFMATNKFMLTKNPKIKFIKLLGTGKGETFTPKDADIYRWGLLVTIDSDSIAALDKSLVVKSWQKISKFEYRVILKPIASHGKWSGKEPFEIEKSDWSGKVAAVTRARIVWRKNFLFWSAVPPVTESLHSASGLIAAIGIGEAPIGLQGTFSIWDSGSALRQFAYKGAAHTDAIKATSLNNWYSEELFARFALIQERGRLN